MKLIESREILLKQIIPCPLLIDRDDVGNLQEITGEIFTPIIVRPSTSENGKFERITGYRRLSKIEKDKKESIRCDIFEMTDEEAILTNAKENLQRKSLNIIEEGKTYQNMLTQLKCSQEGLADLLTGHGKKTSQERISNAIRLLKLPKAIQDYLALNKLSVYKGLLLLRIDDENIQIELANDFIKNQDTDRKAEERMYQLKDGIDKNNVTGQKMFLNSRNYLPSPDNIQDKPKKFALMLKEPYCTGITEIIKDLEKKQANNCIHCDICPAKQLCAIAVKLHMTHNEKPLQVLA